MIMYFEIYNKIKKYINKRKTKKVENNTKKRWEGKPHEVKQRTNVRRRAAINREANDVEVLKNKIKNELIQNIQKKNDDLAFYNRQR